MIPDERRCALYPTFGPTFASFNARMIAEFADMITVVLFILETECALVACARARVCIV